MPSKNDDYSHFLKFLYFSADFLVKADGIMRKIDNFESIKPIFIFDECLEDGLCNLIVGQVDIANSF